MVYGTCRPEVKPRIHINGSQGANWVKANMTIPAVSQPHNFVIRVTHGDGTYGDVAIDDIQYFDSACDGKT